MTIKNNHDKYDKVSQSECDHMLDFGCIICLFVTSVVFGIVTLLVGVVWWGPFLTHNISTGCTITGCTNTQTTCSRQECDSVCYNIDYNCTNTCITYEALNVSEIYCNTNSTFQCNTSATATLQCYYDDRDVENTLSTTNDDYSNKLIGIHWTFSVFLVLSVLVGFFAVVFRCLCDCTEQQDPCLRYNHTCYKLLCRCSLVD